VLSYMIEIRSKASRTLCYASRTAVQKTASRKGSADHKLCEGVLMKGDLDGIDGQ
jgi:hypothetical protein